MAITSTKEKELSLRYKKFDTLKNWIGRRLPKNL
jgi:hypothetical protein